MERDATSTPARRTIELLQLVLSNVELGLAVFFLFVVSGLLLPEQHDHFVDHADNLREAHLLPDGRAAAPARPWASRRRCACAAAQDADAELGEALQAEERRIRCSLTSNVAVREAKVGNTDVPFATAPSFDRATGVAAIDLDATQLAPALEAALRLLLNLGEMLRAVALRVSCGSTLGGSFVASERAARALDALHALGVPIVCAADGGVGGVGMAVWSNADYRISSKGSNGISSKRTNSIHCTNDTNTSLASWHNDVVRDQCTGLTRRRWE